MDSRIASLRRLQTAVKKEHGSKMLGSVKRVHLDLPRIPTGSLSFDFALGGGIPGGRTTIFRGSESCIDGEMRLKYDVVVDGRVVNRKGGSISRLYERFTGNIVKKNRKGRAQGYDNPDFFAVSVNHDGCIIKNKILDVLKTGNKPCYRVEMDSGEVLVSTLDHKYMTPSGFVPLSNLSEGDVVFVHNGTRKKGRKHYPTRKSVCVKYHPLAPEKIVRCNKINKDYSYCRVQLSHLAYEAHLNDMTLSEYRHALNSLPHSEIDKMRFVPKGMHVHHEDEDFDNNDISNLRLIDPSSHGRLHSRDNISNLSFIVAEARIVSIDSIGNRDTYDLKCAYPYNNYVVNGVVVHNSGKTEKALRIIGIAQKLCANCLRRVEDLEVHYRDIVDKDTKESVSEAYATGTCDCYQAGLFDPRQYPDEKADEYKERLKAYEENSFEEFRAALMDMENSMVPDWAARLGVDLDRLIYFQPKSAEEGIDIYDDLLRTGAVDLIALDSIALMSPTEEIQKSAHDQQQGLQARLMGKFTRKLAATVNSAVHDFGRLPTQIWINQEREKIGVSFGDNSVMPGGKAQLFYCAVIVKLWASKREKQNINDGMIEEHKMEFGTQVRMNFKVEKSKVGPAPAGGMYILKVSGEEKGQIDQLKFLIAQAEKFGLYREEGKGAQKRWYLGKEEYKTKKALLERIEETGVLDHIKDTVLKKMLGQV